MIVILVVILAAIIAIILIRMNKISKLPDYLRGKKVDQYNDLMTDRSIYIAAFRNPGTGKYTNEAYYVDDNSNCIRALIKQPYGFMYYENGELKIVPKSFALNLLDRIRDAKISSEKSNKKLAEDFPKEDDSSKE